ncbi:DUF1822 family protein [Iningainema tapete]|uniref:DUF1822 family protein n=1 Tax=Iningainema tapete BLCC-T55 TaxID=2748662 RepID=A0A8J7CAU1_9CYAN|nr:DUF1822 family protein [Iningainema tapete]MBD2771555.1 DUF1822 family protein [Iningainema tapete BLCC-T55]
MTRTNYELDDTSLKLPITQAYRENAQAFAQVQPTPEKAEQVLFNTLSVLVLSQYLQMMGINTSVNTSYIYNPVIRLCADVADLELPGFGRLECRPVRNHSSNCYIPPETWEERVGYVVVQIDESLQEARVLGFVRSVAVEELPLSQLQPFEDLFAHLAQLKHTPAQTLVNLSQWVNGIFEAGWQTLESLLSEPQLTPAYAFRDAHEVDSNPQEALNRRAKLIDLGIQIANQPVILIVEINPEVDGQTSIRLQLHPTGNQVYLPTGVQLTVLDESEAVFLEAQARIADNYIQLQFRGEPGEKFSVKVTLDNAGVTEQFVI